MATWLDYASPLSVTTRRMIREDPAIVDNVFNNDVLNWILRNALRVGFPGGTVVQETFWYSGMIGGSYMKGKQFNTAQKQIEKAAQFEPKYMEVAVPFFQEDIEVINRGKLAVISMLKERVDNAYMTLGAQAAIAAYMSSSKPNGMLPNVLGLAEALNDGSTQSWDGQTYATYGGLTRASYGNALKSVPVNVNGELTNTMLNRYYSQIMFGSGKYEPNFGITTPNGFAFLSDKYQTQQRFVEVTVPQIGFTGMKFRNATICASRYCPGAVMTGLDPSVGGAQDDIAKGYLTETSDGLITTYPTGNLNQGGNPSETFWLLNARKPFLNYYISDSPLYSGGFRDFVPESNSTVLVGLVLLAHVLTASPRYHKQLYGITS